MANVLNKQGTYALRDVLTSVREALRDPANRKDFEEWYRKTYGTDYVWKYRDTETGEIYEERRNE